MERVEKLIGIGFDLSSVGIGVTFSQIDKKEKKFTYGKTITIIPERLNPKDLGYTTKNPKRIAYNGQEFNGYLKEGEFSISKTEADRRRRELKSKEHNFLLRNIGEQCGKFINHINPDFLVMEKNASFNGVLTTKLLAEIAGGLYFYAGAKGIDLYDYNESTVRARIRRDIPEFSYEKDDLVALDTKWEIYCRLREYFTREHPGIFEFEGMTMDESDSLAVMYYYYVTEVMT